MNHRKSSPKHGKTWTRSAVAPTRGAVFIGDAFWYTPGTFELFCICPDPTTVMGECQSCRRKPYELMADARRV